MKIVENLPVWVNEFVINYGLKILAALVTLFLGLWLIKLITKTIASILVKKNFDPSLRGFLKSLIDILLKILLFISVVSMLGVQMTSFIAILGAAGLAVGMALSGTLQNFAGGMMILVLKPFKVGDFVEAQGYSGTVNEIQIFNTILKTPDNRTIIIPNGGLANGSMINYSTEEQRRIDFTFGIAYGDDYDKAKAVLLRFINEDERILKTPEPFIVLGELADSSVNLTVRIWTKSSDFWSVRFAMIERVYKEFPHEGLNIPFPQMDIHMKQES